MTSNLKQPYGGYPYGWLVGVRLSFQFPGERENAIRLFAYSVQRAAAIFRHRVKLRCGDERVGERWSAAA